MTYWKVALSASAAFAEIVGLSLIVGSMVDFSPAAASEHATATSWVGETLIEDKVSFVRVGPQIFAGPEPFLHRPSELLFNQVLHGLAVSESTISFAVVGDDGEPIQAFAGKFGDDHYSGTVHGADGDGLFKLYPTATVPDSTILATFAGTYELAAGVYRTVGFEDLAGMVETRLYYSDGEDFVLLYPLSKTEYMTESGERIRFEMVEGNVSAMTIMGRAGEHRAPKIALYTEVEVTFESGDATIAGTLAIPKTPGPHPAVIIAHSSGGGERHAYSLFASQIVQDGLAVLTYDRRGHGMSTGGGPFNLDTEVLAEDMKAGFAYLQTRLDIDPHGIGLMGFSNGSWVAPRAAKDLADVAFISVSMASGVSQVDAELFRRESVLRAAGVSEESITQAVEALELYYKGSVSSFNEDEAAEFSLMYLALTENEELQSAQGFNILPTNTPLEEILSAGGSMAFMGFSPTETYLTTDAPVSFFVGELDENIPVGLSRPAMEDVIMRRPNADITFVVYPDALHGMFVLPAPVEGISQDFLYPNLASYQFATGYIPQLRSWLREKAGLIANE